MEYWQTQPRKPSVGERLSGAIGAGLQQAGQISQASQQKEAIGKALGADAQNLPPEMQKLAYQAKLSGENEKAKRVLELQGNQQQINAIEDERGLERGTLKDFVSDPAMAERISKPKAEKAPPGGLGGIPMTPEESKAFSDVIRNNPDASAEELEIAFNEAGIKPGHTAKTLESRRRIQESKAKSEEEKVKTERKEALSFHKETEKYDEDLLKHEKSAKVQLDAIKDVEKALKGKEVKPTSLANVFKAFGDIGKKISSALISGNQATIQASIPAFLEGRKELFGVRLSDADLKLLEDKMPDMGKSAEANKAIMRVMKKYSQNALIRSKIGNDIRSENKGLRPLGYAGIIERRFDEVTQPVTVISPTGKEVEIPAYGVSDAIKNGYRLPNDEQE